MFDQVETATYRAEHAQCQHVDLEQTDRIEVVLVPLDHRAVGHAGILDRHQGVERLFGDHEAARVLGQVTGKADKRIGQHQDPAQNRIVRVEAGLAQSRVVGYVLTPASTAAGQGVDLVRRQAQRLGDIPQGAGGAVAAGDGGEGGAITPVALKDVLDDLLAAVVLEIHVDIGRLVALAGEETLEQQFAAYRVEFGDAQYEADARVGRRAPTLAENAPLAGEANDVMHGQEIAFVMQVGDQLQFMFELRAGLFRDAVRPAPACAILDQLAQP